MRKSFAPLVASIATSKIWKSRSGAMGSGDGFASIVWLKPAIQFMRAKKMQQLTVAIEALNNAIDALNKATDELELAVRIERERLRRITSEDEATNDQVLQSQTDGRSEQGARIVYIDRVARKPVNQGYPPSYIPTSLGDII